MGVLYVVGMRAKQFLRGRPRDRHLAARNRVSHNHQVKQTFHKVILDMQLPPPFPDSNDRCVM